MGKKLKKPRRDVAEIARENLEKIIGEKLSGGPLEAEHSSLDEQEPRPTDPNEEGAGESGLPQTPE